MGTRIYEVKATITATVGKSKEQHTEEHIYLVEATSHSVAARHVAAKYIQKAEIATPKRIVELMEVGHKLESAKEAE